MNCKEVKTSYLKSLSIKKSLEHRQEILNSLISNSQDLSITEKLTNELIEVENNLRDLEHNLKRIKSDFKFLNNEAITNEK
jgi:hypothetical protein